MPRRLPLPHNRTALPALLDYVLAKQPHLTDSDSAHVLPATAVVRTVATMSFESVMPPYNSSDPGASFISSSALDFLLIELVPLAYRVTSDIPSPNTGAESNPTGNNGATVTSPSRHEEDETSDAVRHKLESTGYRVGQGLVERFVVSSTLT